MIPTVPLPGGSGVVQVCHVVPDLERACAEFHRAWGIGPFVGGTSFTLDNHVHRGRPAAPIELRGVFVQSGDLNIELVEIHSEGPSAFHDMFPDRGMTGVHHVAMFVPDYAAARDHLVAAGYPVASEFVLEAFDAQICYIDMRAVCGHMLELYPENAAIRGMYAQARAIAGDWSAGSLIVPWA